MAPNHCRSLRGCNYFLALQPGANKNVGRRISAGVGHSNKGSTHVLSGIDGVLSHKDNVSPFLTNMETIPGLMPCLTIMRVE